MELTPAQSVTAIVTALVGGGFLTAVITWLLNRRKYRTETLPAEGAGMETLLTKIRTLINENLDNTGKIQKLTTESAALRVLVQVRDEELVRQTGVLKDILVEQGRAEERERQCQERLSQVMEKLTSYEDLHQVNRRLVQDNLRMQGEIDELHLNKG